MTQELVISTKDRLGSYDAIETAKPDEPLFPIQGGDPFGPPTVLYWAQLARDKGMAAGTDPKLSAKLLRKATEAEQVAWEMQAYQRGEAIEAAKAEEKAVQIVVDDTDHDRAEREARIKGAERLHNVVGQAIDIAELLERLWVLPEQTAALRNAVDQIKAVAAAVEPRRDNERS